MPEEPLVTVANLMVESGQTRVFTTRLTDSVAQAARDAKEHNCSALIVLDDEGTYQGIYTERDGSWDVLAEDLTPSKVTVGTVMTPKDKVRSVSATHSALFCLDLMIELKVRHLPVERDGEIVGVISERDIVHHYRKLLTLSEELARYITGAR